MAASRLARRVEADDGPVNIQLGIFIPPQTTNNRKRPSKKPITTEPESKNDEKQRSELNGRTGRKRKRLDSGDSVDEKTIDTPEAEETENDTESEENDGEETSGKAKRKRKRRKKKRKLTREGTSSDSKEKALEYLASWESGSPGWAFRKKSQYWLLKNAYDRHKVSLWIETQSNISYSQLFNPFQPLK